MKKLCLFVFLLVLILLIPIKSQAFSDYSIQSYDVSIIVNENNTLDITEKIGVNFIRV